MRILKTVLAASLAISSFGLTSTAAQANVSDSEINAVRLAMLTKAEAAKIGVKATASTFTVAVSHKAAGTLLDDRNIWLCDDLNDVDITIPGSKLQFQANHASETAKVFRSVTQTLHRYPSAKAANAAYKLLTKRMAACTGEKIDTAGGVTFTTTVTNGTSNVKDGDSVAWIAVDGDLSGGASAMTSHDYTAFHVDGNVIVQLNLDIDGPGAPAITKKQRKIINELACDVVHRS
jgi:hypothetical protein